MPKTRQQYLDDHKGDAEAALDAAIADIDERERNNATARSFRRTFEPLLRELDIPATQEGVEQLREALSAGPDSEAFEALAETVEDLTGLLGDLGIDFDAPEDELQAQLDALPQRWQDAQAAMQERDTLRSEQESRELADIGKANAGVLRDRLQTAGLSAKVVGEAPKPGEQDKRTVRVYDKDGKDLGELREYATSNWGDYLTSLFPSQTAQSQGGKVVTAQAGAGAGAQAKEANPLTESINRRSAAGQGQDAPVVDALSFNK